MPRSEPRRIAIIGAGRLGRALANGWAAAGHAVHLGARAAARPAGLERSVTFAGAHAAAAGAEAMVLAVPAASLRTALLATLPRDGTIVVDPTNHAPDAVHFPGRGETRVERLALEFPGLRFVKAFNTVSAAALGRPHVGGAAATVFLCGEDAAARAVVAALAVDLGLEAADVGPLGRACQLEAVGQIGIALAIAAGPGHDVAFRVLRGRDRSRYAAWAPWGVTVGGEPSAFADL
jgi:8-hydroxy-5-deazaflavin:NADPH oxidoreductase